MDEQLIGKIVGLVVLMVFITCVFTALRKISKLQTKIWEKQQKIEDEFMSVLKEHKQYLDSTPCNADTIEEYMRKGNELVEMKVPRINNCQHYWGVRAAQYDYAITWYKKSIGEESNLAF